MVDEAFSASDLPPILAPHGFSVRCSPAGLTGPWHDVIALGDQRVGVLIGCCADGNPEALSEAARALLLQTGDPVRSLEGVRAYAESGHAVSALCAVIDAETISYSTHGDALPAVAAPDAVAEVYDRAPGRLEVVAVGPGATVVLGTGPVDNAGGALAGCSTMHPEQVADRVVARLTGPGVVMVYRHPPAPLAITLPATPDNLAISRGRLREWLASAAVDAESCADVLLAVGEATANATEHAVLGADTDVQITLTASITGLRVEATVSDNGVWKPAAVSAGHRGHGIHLINALVDSADLITNADGTTVTMLKEVRP